METFERRKELILNRLYGNIDILEKYIKHAKDLNFKNMMDPKTETELKLSEALCIFASDQSYLEWAAKLGRVNIPAFEDNRFTKFLEIMFLGVLRGKRINKIDNLKELDDIAKFMFDCCVFGAYHVDVIAFFKNIALKNNFDLYNKKDYIKFILCFIKFSICNVSIKNFLPFKKLPKNYKDEDIENFIELTNAFHKVVEENKIRVVQNDKDIQWNYTSKVR